MPRKRKGPTVSAIPVVPVLPLNDLELARELQITLDLQELYKQVRQRNLHDAVLLAQQALAGKGPLIDHFCELGRRFGRELSKPKRPALRIVEGGGAVSAGEPEKGRLEAAVAKHGSVIAAMRAGAI